MSILDMTLTEAIENAEELQFELAKSIVAMGIEEDAHAAATAKAFTEEFLDADRQKRAVQDLLGIGEGVQVDQERSDPETT